MGTNEGAVIRADLRLPDVSNLDDAGLAHWFPGFDGQWSDQTKALRRAHGATGLDLNANWAEVPPDWRCKCCNRPKPMIVRKAPNGVLLAHLHLHHDHLRDHLQALINARVGIPWVAGVGVASGHADEHMRMLLVRFRDTLICDACNAADGTAKRNLGPEVHGAFSFSPTEIARFVRPRANALHEVDTDAARAVWNEVRAEFENRLGFAEVLVGRLAAGHFALERVADSVMPFARSTGDRMIDHKVRGDEGLTAMRTWHSRVDMQLRAKSVRSDGVGNSGRVRKPVVARRPTDAERAEFELRAGMGWQRTPADWTCPCCHRGKPALLRLSKTGQWFAQLRIHTRSEIETGPENLRFRKDLYGHGAEGIVVALRRQGYICSDCGDVSSKLLTTRQDMLRMPVLTLEDIRACLGEVRDNEKIKTDLAEAEVRDRANADLGLAETEFARHRSLGINLWALWLKFKTHPDIASVLTDRAKSEGLDVDAVPDAMRWLLLQGKVLHTLHRQEIEHGLCGTAGAAEGATGA